MVAVGDKVAIRATYRGTVKDGFIPNMLTTGKAVEMEAHSGHPIEPTTRPLAWDCVIAHPGTPRRSLSGSGLRAW